MENLIAILLGGSWASGINVYMTAAGLGLAHRLGWLALPGELDILANPFLIGLAVLMYAVEFVADKIPFFDSVWDMMHTFIRPLAGVMLGYLATTEAGPLVQTAVAALTGSVSLSSHLSKATSRAAVNATPVPFANTAVSVAEDTVVAGVLYFVMRHPIIAIFLAVSLIVLSVWLLLKLFRFLKRIFRPVKKEESLACG